MIGLSGDNAGWHVHSHLSERNLVVPRKILLGLGLAWAVLAACGGGLDFTIRFTAIEGLRTGDPVRTDTREIGEVRAVEYSDQGDYRVAVHIEGPHADQVVRRSLFFIDADPQRRGRKVLMVLSGPDAGTPIEDGATVEGTSKWAALMQRMTRQMETGVAGLAAEIGQYWQDLQNLSTSEQAERLEQELDRIIAELKRLGASARHELQTKILPRLRDQLEQLRRKLEGPEHEEQLDRLEDKVERIDRELQV
jgi:ABC-type transporter Mla subunit MlaD